MRLLIILCTEPHRTPPPPSRVGDGKFLVLKKCMFLWRIKWRPHQDFRFDPLWAAAGGWRIQCSILHTASTTSFRLETFGIQASERFASWSPHVDIYTRQETSLYFYKVCVIMSPNQKNIISTLDSTPTVAVLGAGWWLVCNHIDLNQEL